MKTSTLTINSIGHGLAVGVILNVNTKLYRVIYKNSQSEYVLAELKLHELLLQNIKYYLRKISRYCKNVVDNINIWA
jgi:hypothetical protein